MKPFRNTTKVAALAIVVSLSGVQSANADLLGVDIGATVETATQSVGSIAADVTASVNTTSQDASATDRNTRVADVDVDAGVSPNSGVTASTCIRLFGRCPSGDAANSQAVANVNVNANVGTNNAGTNNTGANTNANAGANTGTCRGWFQRCTPSQRAEASGQVATAPTPAASRPNNDRDTAIAPFNAREPFDANRMRGIILMSNDNEVLGIVQDARWMEDGTMMVDVQISNTVGVSRTVATVQFRPVRQPTDRITFGVTARQFAASLS